MNLIPVSEPLLGELEFQYVSECLRTGWISSAGRFIKAFEEKWAEYCGRQYGVAVSSGTTALQVAVDCLGLEPEDEVIMPTFTIISCALCVVHRGAIPVLVDSEPRTWCMDTSQIESKVTPKTRAILVVHIYGHPVDMDPVWEIARKYDLAIIEDAAEAHGAQYLAGKDSSRPEWRRCGGLGDLATFSFYANKLINTGEGGMVLTDDPSCAEKARSLRNLGFRHDRRFLHTELGNNFRLTNMQAALGLAQLERMAEIVQRKRWMGQAYTENLQDLAMLQLPVEEPWARQVYWMYGVVLDDASGMDAFELARSLKAQGVETRPFFLGMHEQPVLLERGWFRGKEFPVAHRLARQGLYLPSGLTLTEEQMMQVCQAVRKALS